MNERVRNELKFFGWCLLFSITLVFLYNKYIGVMIFGPSKGDQKVIIFVTSWCPYCEKLKQQLDDIDVVYEEHDIEVSKKAYFTYYSLGGGGVPISVIGDKVIYGYKPDLIRSEIHKQGLLGESKNR